MSEGYQGNFQPGSKMIELTNISFLDKSKVKGYPIPCANVDDARDIVKVLLKDAQYFFVYNDDENKLYCKNVSEMAKYLKENQNKI